MLAKASLRTSTACRMSSRSMCGNLNLRTSSSVTPVCPLAPDSACWNWICPSGDANRSTNAIGSIPEGRRIATWLSIANSSSRSKRTGFPMLVPPSTVKSTSFLFGGLAQPYSNTARDAPPVAVSRVGCCELPRHVHRSQRNRRVPVISFRCRQTCTATTALDTPTLLPRVVINAVPFSGHPALAISSSKLWSRSASVINL